MRIIPTPPSHHVRQTRLLRGGPTGDQASAVRPSSHAIYDKQQSREGSDLALRPDAPQDFTQEKGVAGRPFRLRFKLESRRRPILSNSFHKILTDRCILASFSRDSNSLRRNLSAPNARRHHSVAP